MEKIKTVVAGVAAFAAAIFYALFQRQQKITAEIEKEHIENVAAAERAANQAMVDGIGYEAGIVAEIENKPVVRTDIS